ncbi:hypothetical protein P0E61_10135 [Enterococcus faecalis]|uniref:immunoglobulin-like domain-containing protein n=1 Tax=Enterococcus faecalis TaxID=1351 RepID=UPI0025B092F6|nr:immunoglobulin-like domain-containing protein [Enterococcus faecalis]MDN3100703.1 hypothetical protein [Enterococcus faecalis]MDN3103395.1 hypothetical protein [Enterococcus faecalis]
MTINPYPYGNEYITGTYTGEIKKAKLYVNDKYTGVVGGTFKSNNFTFYVKGRFKSTDKVELEGLSGQDKILVEKQQVEIITTKLN